MLESTPIRQAPLRARVDGGVTPTADVTLGTEADRLTDVLLGDPGGFRWLGAANAQYSSIVRDSVRRDLAFDQQLAMRQHRELVECYEAAGVACHFLPLDAANPYQVYARDSSVMTPYGAVICQLANPRRRGEYADALRFYLARGIPIFDCISAGQFEGGDFLPVGEKGALIGYTDHRSEGVAAEQLAGWLRAEGWDVELVPIDPFFVHIDVMVGMVGTDCAVACTDILPDHALRWLEGRGIDIVPVSYAEAMLLGCNVMSLGDRRVISTASAPRMNADLRARGYTVFDPDMSMFVHAGGSVHCMCQPLSRVGGAP